MKKVSVILLIIILFNFIYTNVTYADSMTVDEYKKLADEGKTNINGSEQELSLNESDVGAGSSAFGTFLAAIGTGCIRVVSNLLCEGDLFYRTESEYSASKTKLLTISSLVFNEYLLLNPAIYQKTTDFTGTTTASSSVATAIDGIKDRAISFSSFFTYVALALCALMFLFSIVKTLLAKNAAEVAAWKKILTRWALCIFLILVFQYIIIAIDVAVDKTVGGLWNVRLSMENNGYQGFESAILEKTIIQYENTGGVTSLAYAAILLLLFIVQMMFLVKYVARTFSLMLLAMIAPIIILFHSINLMLGKESNILGELFKNYLALSFMQAVHALFYLIFFFSFSEMAIAVPVLGILLLYMLLRAGSVIKAMFGWELSSSMFSLKGKE